MPKEEYDYEAHRCQHPSHPTTFVNKHFKCHRAYKCQDKGQEGCIAK